jgi:hypothetical protein
MTKLTYFPLTDDLIEPLDASAITITGEQANYPAANVRTIEMGETARGTINGKIQITFPAGVAPRFWAILNHNLYAGDVTIRTYTTAFDTSGGPTPSGESCVVPFRLSDMKVYITPAMSAQRFWELDFNGCYCLDAFLEVGKVMAGLVICTFLNDFSGFQSGADYRNIYNETQGGVCYAHRLERRRRAFALSWNASKVAEALPDILELLELTRGGAYPFVLIPNNDAADLYYVRSADAVSWTEQSARAFLTGLTLHFKELSRGRIQVEA